MAKTMFRISLVTEMTDTTGVTVSERVTVRAETTEPTEPTEKPESPVVPDEGEGGAED